jgi:hypothetical protein
MSTSADNLRGYRLANPRAYQVFHNYIRPHMGLDGKTPAEAAGIKVEGNDKWKTLIQNASRTLCKRD